MINLTKQHRLEAVGMLLGLLLGLSLLAFEPVTLVSAAVTNNWQDTSLSLPATTSGFCSDATHPGILFVNEGSYNTSNGTWAYNWQTGHKTQINQRHFSICGNNGYLYATEDGKPPLRFSLDDPAGKELAHTPYAVARDGSLTIYALDHSVWDFEQTATQNQNHLWLSQDGGMTWEERAKTLTGVFWNVAVSPTDARSIYLLTRTLTYGPITNPDFNQYGINIFYSADGGVNWDHRYGYATQPENPAPSIFTFNSINSPVNALALSTIDSPIHEGPSYKVSFDGGRTFKEYAYVCVYDCAPGSYGEIVSLDYGARSLLHLVSSVNYTDPDHPFTSVELQSIQPNGVSQTMPVPDGVQKLYSATLQVVSNEPDNLLLSAASNQEKGTNRTIWYSPDSGKNWQQLPGTMDTLIPTAYAPLTLLGIKDNHLYSFKPDNAEKQLTQAALSNENSANPYYNETGHNLSNLFKSYWETHGGLAQFGYPRTEPFREYNPSDGKIYTVQYFERNRFEYHPENSGTPFEVLLGLLGNQLTQDRRNAGDGAFNRFSDMHYPGATYFSEVGHNLRNSFKDYWENNGGLAIYGYPISEEFEEANPDDGKTYVVQYFERARFEYHPEFKGTKSEVLLGLLGNSLLRLKGWL